MIAAERMREPIVTGEGPREFKPEEFPEATPDDRTITCKRIEAGEVAYGDVVTSDPAIGGDV